MTDIPSVPPQDASNETKPVEEKDTPSILPPHNTIQPDNKIKTPMKPATVVGIMVGFFIVFVLGVIVFQPRAYLWVLAQAGQANRQMTETNVLIDRSIVDLSGAAEAGSNAYADAIQVLTNTSYIGPDTWSFVTKVVNPDTGETGDGIEVKIFNQEAFQREADTDTEYVAYEFQDGEFDSTVKAIQSSSFFQKGILDYVHKPRFVWNPDGQSWWLAHYEFQVDVAELLRDNPDWYEVELYPFGVEPTLGEQDITFIAEVWMNPFTGKPIHEVWHITKANKPGATVYDVDLDITMTRSFSYPGELTIEKPT